MSGVGDFGISPESIPTPELVKKIMADFEVDEEEARRIISFAVVMAMDMQEKWRRNWKKLMKGKADGIYRLFRNAKRGSFDKLTIDEIEKRILELCVEI